MARKGNIKDRTAVVESHGLMNDKWMIVCQTWVGNFEDEIRSDINRLTAA